MRGMFAHTGDSALAAGGACFKTSGGTNSESSADTNQYDQRVGVDGGSIGIGAGAHVNFENPEGFAALLAAGAGVFESALEFAGNESEKSAAAYGLALGAVSETKRSEAQHFGLEVLKQAAPILLVVGLGAALVMASK